MQGDKLFSGNDYNRIARFNRILTLLQKPMIISRLADLVPEFAYDTTRLDCNELVNIGYVAKNANKLQRGRVFEYHALKSQLDLRDYRPISSKRNETYAETMKLKKEKQPSGGTIIRLTETTHWYSEKKKTGRVYIGSTLSDAYMGV